MNKSKPADQRGLGRPDGPTRPFDPMLYSIERHMQLQELACKKARERGLSPGFEDQDWLAAEREIGS